MSFARSLRKQRSYPQLEPLEDRIAPSASVYRSEDVPRPIPDGGATTSIVHVPDRVTIGDVDVALNIVHPRGADLNVFLIAPGGTRVELLTAVAFPLLSGEVPFRALTLDEQAEVSIREAQTRFVGRYRPEGFLSGLMGQDSQGTWTLEVSDGTAGKTGFIADWELTISTFTTEAEPNSPPAPPQTIDPSSVLSGEILTSEDEDSFTFTVPTTGRLQVRVSAGIGSLLDPRLTLCAADSRALVQSDDIAADDPASLLDQHLNPGTYLLRVSAQVGAGDGSQGNYLLRTAFSPTPPPLAAPSVETFSVAILLADVNGDGGLDLVTASYLNSVVSVLLGNSDGSFRAARAFPVGLFPTDVEVADLDRDGRPDLIASNSFTNDVSVLIGEGDGSFQEERRFDCGESPASLAIGDMNEDGWLELIVANADSKDVSILLGIGAGFFQPEYRILLSDLPFEFTDPPRSVAVADLDGDGHLDIVTANGSFTGTISIVAGNGDGTFGAPDLSFLFGEPNSLVIADINGDERPDLIVAGSGSLTIRRNNGDGTFEELFEPIEPGIPQAVAVADVNGDDWRDLITANNSGDVSVLLNRGDDSFQPELRYQVGSYSHSVAIGDVNGDGRLDLATGNVDEVTVLLGNGDGSFRAEPRFLSGSVPNAVVVKDINGDGRPDLIAANVLGGDVSVLLGNGEGTFESARQFFVGDLPASVAVEDLNGDGRPDLIAAVSNFDYYHSDEVAVLLGNGDGSFQPRRTFRVGEGAFSVTAGDLDRDGRPDLVTANPFDHSVSVLLGKGDGSFRRQRRIPVDLYPVTVVVSSINGDGKPDLLTANFDGTVSVLLGKGDGTFRRAPSIRMDVVPASLAVEDVNRDGNRDVITTNTTTDEVSVFLGNGKGVFDDERRFAVGENPRSVVVQNVAGDGALDLIVANYNSSDVSVLLGNGDGSFQAENRYPVGVFPSQVAVGDVNGDGRLDLLSANRSDNDLSVLLGNPDGMFTLSNPERVAALRHVPLWGDLDGDSTPDTVVLNDAGEILFRRGLPGAGNLFAPPVVLNVGRPVRDITLLHAPTLVIAASNAQGDTVSVYRFVNNGFQDSTAFTAGQLPQRILAAHMDGDALEDLIVANVLGDSVSIAFQRGDGSFAAMEPLPVGVTPSEVAVADIDGQAGRDVLVTNRSSGDVSVLYNDGAHSFIRRARFRAGTSVSGLQAGSNSQQPHSREDPVGFATGLFTGGDTAPDLLIVNRGSHQLRTLLGTRGGGFTNPDDRYILSTSQGLAVNERPGQVVATDLDGDGRLDAAIVMENRHEVWLYQGHGDGTFALLTTVPAGNSPTGLSPVQLNDDNGDATVDDGDFVDLLVGNGFGDILFILGNGDGSFRPFVRADNRVAFVATDLNGDQAIDVVLAEAASDVARSLSRDQVGDRFTPGAFRRDSGDGLIGPGDVKLADLDGRFGEDLIFANTGSNNVLIYLRQKDGTFSDVPLSFFAGTSPTGLHVAQLNDDNNDGRIDRHDLVDLAIANQGSNDVSVLLGSRGSDANRDGVFDRQDLFKLGPRLATDQFGPSFVTSRDVDGDKVPDLLAASTQGSSATLLPGVGNGFFDDNNATTIDLGSPPLALDRNFALLGNGSIVSLDFSGATTFFTSTERQPVAFQAFNLPDLDFPVFFTANADGTVSAIVSTDGVNYSELDNRFGDGLDSPSALAVLQGTNTLEVYVSDARDNGLIVLRFGLEDFPTSRLTSLGGSESLVLAAILTNSLLVENRPASVSSIEAAIVFGLEETSSDLPVIGGIFVNEGELLLSGLEETLAELDEETPQPPPEPFNLQHFLTGLQEAMRELGWTRRQARPVAPLLSSSEDLDGAKWLSRGAELLSRFVAFFQTLADAAGERAVPRSAMPPMEPAPRSFDPPEPESYEDAVRTAIEGAESARTEQEAMQRGEIAALVSTAVFAAWMQCRPRRRGVQVVAGGGAVSAATKPH